MWDVFIMVHVLDPVQQYLPVPMSNAWPQDDSVATSTTNHWRSILSFPNGFFLKSGFKETEIYSFPLFKFENDAALASSSRTLAYLMPYSTYVQADLELSPRSDVILRVVARC